MLPKVKTCVTGCIKVEIVARNEIYLFLRAFFLAAMIDDEQNTLLYSKTVRPFWAIGPSLSRPIWTGIADRGKKKEVK